MQVEPSFAEFERRHAIGHPVLVWTTLIADLETPVSAMLKLADGRANSFLLESFEGGEKIGRYSVIGIKPDLIWRCFGDRVEVNRRARIDPGAFEPAGSGALASLRALIAECRVDMPAPLPPSNTMTAFFAPLFSVTNLPGVSTSTSVAPGRDSIRSTVSSAAAACAHTSAMTNATATQAISHLRSLVLL